MRREPGVVAVLVTCAALLSGCVSGAQVRPGGSPQAAAQAESTDLLTAFHAPPGARPLTGPPTGAPWEVSAPFSRPASPALAS
ncbi:hypothetical protein ABH931_003997 [Streptacidiphilus sp. MAP12-33]|uniref:hypothetical protein n=1 Tax=Streptacidiphilus sp. MAP12-33 TaxID=3156266 RepID=UPI00351592D3